MPAVCQLTPHSCLHRPNNLAPPCQSPAVSAASSPSSPVSSCSLSLLPHPALSIPLQTIDELTPSSPRTLVLSTSPSVRQTHSLLFASLASRDHVLTFAHPYDDHLRLYRHSSALYDNLILFTEGMEDFGEAVPVDAFVQWVDDGHNLVLVWGTNVSEPIRLLAYDLGAVIAEDGDLVVDHFHVDHAHEAALGSGEHTFISTTNAIDAEVITGLTAPVPPILFHGLPHTFTLASSASSAPLYIPILRAEATAVSATDAAPILVSAWQTRSSTRVLFCGSSELLSNAFLSSSLPSAQGGAPVRTGNAAFVESVLAWTFRERGVLRARELVHHQVDGMDVNPHSYRVSDYTAFSIVIEEFTEAHVWRPFLASDIPLSFTMIDPYIRHPLTPHPNGTYTTAFQVPDVYGVYKFVVEYRRPGYSALSVSQQVSVTPYRHDQYERFLWVAYPYYASALTLMGAFLLFGVVFLYGRDGEWQVKKSAEVKRVTETHSHTVTEIKAAPAVK